MVQKKTPGYERLTPEVRSLVSAGMPIRLDNRNVTHLKYGESGYSRYGVGMIRRLFPILSYKTKLMVAQWIVAERLIVPIKIVKVGSDERPAGPADIAAVQQQLAQTANDPNLTIVTHHAFELDWYGAAGKVLTLSNEFEFINQEILDGMMINNALLNGEGPNFSNAAVGIEAMVERLETFRREMANWIEEYIYKPEAIRQGFFEKDEDTGEDEPIYPKVKWNSMHLRDQQQYRTFVLQLYEKGLLSAQTVLEAFDFDPDQEIERKRYDAVQMMALGQGMGAGAPGMGGGMDMGGGFGGGGMPPMPGGDMGGGDMMGGEMGGGEMGGAPISPPAGGGAGPALASSTRQISADVADPSQYGGKVLKQKTREKMDAEKQKIYQQQQKAPQGMPGQGMRDDKGRIVFTGPERELLAQLVEYRKNGLVRYPIIPQFEVQYGSSVYPIDFAIPHLKIGIEADGEVFHSSPKQITHDKERDMKLSQSGWTILRFKDEEIERKVERVMSKIVQTIMQKEATIEKQKKQIS
jgi:very-short-patch-repair endonuclease